MFSPADRERLKATLIRRAEGDEHVVSAALLGSSSTGEEDRFSDIDLALSIEGGEVEATIDDWTGFMYEEADAVHHLDVRVETTVYRVFLLRDSLQVDLSFWASSEFTATGPRFRLLFGDPPIERPKEQRSPDTLIGEAWLYLIHARSSLGRNRPWQTNYMLAMARDRILELACLRHGLRPDEARCVDDLPTGLLEEYVPMVTPTLEVSDLAVAIRAAASALTGEVGSVSTELAERIAEPVKLIGDC